MSGGGHSKNASSFGGGAGPGAGAGGGGGGAGGAQSFGDWFQQYQQQQEQGDGDDVEMGLLGNVDRFFRDRGFGPAQDQAAAFAGRFVAGIRGEDGIVAGAKSTVDNTLNYGVRLRTFLALLFLGILFYLLAFFVALPVIVLRPAKFALSATMGSILTMGSFSALVGPWAHLQSLLKWERLPFSAAYLGSLALTLYASLVARSYLLVVFSTLLQIGAFAWYLLAFLPGGPQGLRMLGSVMVRGVGAAAVGCTRMVGWCVSG